MKKATIPIIIVLLVAIIIYFIARNPSQPVQVVDETPITTPPSATTTPIVDKTKTVIGASVEGRAITAYHFGTGTSTEVLFVGGIHGGYEWNTALVAYQLVDYLKTNPTSIPANVKVTVIPALNPDGLNQVVGTTTGNFTAANVSADMATVIDGRFNANNVDLNRNFDCDWQTKGTWNKTPVSGGTAAFSEPESAAIKSYIEMNDPAAVVVWYSAAGGVFASNCHSGVSVETDALTTAFAKASGYPGHASFDFYETTGDMTNWLAKIGTPAISILLTNHTDTEWTKNLAGVKAVLEYYAD